MTKQHTLKLFEDGLNDIEKRVLLMAEQVRKQVIDALNGLHQHNATLIEQVIQDDKSVNFEETQLNEACIQLIARHAPQANDLRLVMTVMQMITDIERIGDEAKKIAKASLPIIQAESEFVPHVELRYVGNLALKMLTDSMDAFARKDVSTVPDIVSQDKEVDAIFRGMIRQLATFMMEDPRLIARSIDILFISKSIERIGDHATNIAEYVVYMVKGQDIRHQTLERIKQQTTA